MAERYKLPDALGGGEYEALTDFKSKVGDDWRFRFKIPGVGCVDIPAEALTPVKPPTPPEPEPGAYLIGSTICIRVHWKRPHQWAIVTEPEADWTSIDWDDWSGLMEFFGPDVTITRLVPERVETVALPWDDGPFSVTVRETDGNPACTVALHWHYRKATMVMTPERARNMAAALLAASRAES